MEPLLIDSHLPPKLHGLEHLNGSLNANFSHLLETKFSKIQNIYGHFKYKWGRLLAHKEMEDFLGWFSVAIMQGWGLLLSSSVYRLS